MKPFIRSKDGTNGPAVVSDIMPLDHNQWAVVAIVSTLCLAGVYTVVDSEFLLQKPVDSNLQQMISSTQIETTFTEGEDTDRDGSPIEWSKPVWN